MVAQPLKIFVISLERAADRRRHMERLLEGLGVEAEFIPAVDGRALTASQRARYDARRARWHYRAEMTDSEIACYLSHYRCYERIANEGLPMALILEDDIAVGPQFLPVVQALAAQAEPEWSVVRLQTQRTRVSKPKSPKDAGSAIGDLPGGGLFRLGTHVLGGCAYMMRRSAAETMLSYGLRIVRPIDQTLDRYWENGILPYVVRPFPVWQHPEFGSQIGNRGRAVRTEERPSDALRGRLVRSLDGLNKRLFAATDMRAIPALRR
jgi:glycosyl transferase family 25